jgi:hypothetical protein
MQTFERKESMMDRVRLLRISLFALAMLFPMVSGAEAAVCRLGLLYDLYPAYVGADGSCVSRAGWAGYISQF